MNSKLKIEVRVRTLKSYLSDFDQGRMQIPTFQRDFVWTPDDIKQLFDSIKNNYPIGSILFWKPLHNSPEWLKSEKSMIGPYQIKSVDTQMVEPNYILDGYQRLSSLFGCLTNPEKYNTNYLSRDEKLWNEKFKLYYDLDEEQFIYLKPKSKNEPYQVPVYIFLSSVDFRQYSRKYFDCIKDDQKVEIYLNRADALGQTFTDFPISSVEIGEASIEEAVEIFRRLNERGQAISKDWIASAFSNIEGFRLGSEINALIDELKPYNFDGIKRDVLFQCIQSSFGDIYFDYKIDELVKRDNFATVAKNSILAIKQAAQFLFEHLFVFNSKLLPYASQLIFISTFFYKLGDGKLTEKQIIALKRWFWITTYSNYFTIYSLSNQRKAFKLFLEFVNDENVDPIYNDNQVKFSTQAFPDKINLGSVRAKALVLFEIHYAMGVSTITTDRIENELIESFEIGNLFTIPQRENPAENCVPIIAVSTTEKRERKRRKNYSYLLESGDDKLIISDEMVDLYRKDCINPVLELRKKKLIELEKTFVTDILELDYQA